MKFFIDCIKLFLVYCIVMDAKIAVMSLIALIALVGIEQVAQNKSPNDQT